MLRSRGLLPGYVFENPGLRISPGDVELGVSLTRGRGSVCGAGRHAASGGVLQWQATPQALRMFFCAGQRPPCRGHPRMTRIHRRCACICRVLFPCDPGGQVIVMSCLVPRSTQKLTAHSTEVLHSLKSSWKWTIGPWKPTSSSTNSTALGKSALLRYEHESNFLHAGSGHP